MIISMYGPTMINLDENKEAFYNQLAMTSGPWVWANMGLGNATPMASFYWFCALNTN